MKLLHIDSSITGTASASRQLSAALVGALKTALPRLEVIRRDLDANPIPHLDSKRLPTVRPANALKVQSGSQTRVAAMCSTSSLPPISWSSAHRCTILASRANSRHGSTASRLPARPSATRQTGPSGWPAGKHVIVASSRGGLYAPWMPFEANDFQERYLRAIFAFIGISDIEIIRAQGLALGPTHRDAALNAAHATVVTTVEAARARHAA